MSCCGHPQTNWCQVTYESHQSDSGLGRSVRLHYHDRVQVRSRIDTPEELNYYRNGGILHYVLRNLAK